MSAGDSRIGELYEAALKRPPGERASFVARKAGADSELRRRVEALLAGQQDTVLPGYEPGAPESLISAGTQIGSYRIEGPLGAGGMGVVYFATDTKLNRPAAIKVLPESLADPEARRRFQREAQMVSSLNHPHIVTVYDAGEYEDRQYLITEYVDGGTLRQWAARAHGWRAIVELLVGVADGIAVAHEAGILHRDIKPENILLAKNGYAKLADFGVAKLLEVDPLSEDPLGARGGEHSTHLGTLAYMSPEQLQGLPLDARSDVYAFGLVLYELLSGQRPFAEREPGALPDPNTLPALGAEVPAELRTTVAKALEPEPADRHQHMRELVVDLRRLARQSGHVPSGGDATGVAQPAKPRRALHRIGGVAAALALIGLVALAVEYVRHTGPGVPIKKAVAVLPFTNESTTPEDASITEGLSDKLREQLQELADLSVVGRVSSVSFRDQRVDVHTIASTLSAVLVINGSVRRVGNALDVRVEILDDRGFAVGPIFHYQRPDSQLLAMQQQIANEVGAFLAPQSVVAADKPTQTSSQSESANMLIVFGRRRENEARADIFVDEDKLQEAIGYYRKATLVDPNSIEAFSRLAAALLYGREIKEAITPLRRALELGALLDPETKSADLSNTHYTAGLYLTATRSGAPAEQFEQAIALNPSNGDALAAYAQWHMTHNRSFEADALFRAAIDLDRQSLPRYVDYAEYLGTREEMDRLREVGREIERRFPNERGYLKLARVYELTGDLDIGIAWALKANRLLAAESASVSPQLRDDAVWQLAELYAKIGDFEEASRLDPGATIGQLFLRKDYDALATAAEEALLLQEEDPDLHYFLAFAYNATGQPGLAKDVLEAIGFPMAELTSIGGTESQAQSYYIDALQALGGDTPKVKDLAAKRLANFRDGIRTGVGKSWWVNTLLACSEAQLDHRAEAIAAIDRIYQARGLPPSPLLEDSPCFKRLADEPRYVELIQHLRDRQKELRDRLPATLREHDVASVRVNPRSSLVRARD